MKTKCILKHVKNDIWWKLDNLIDDLKEIVVDCLIILGITAIGAAIFTGVWYIIFTFIPVEIIIDNSILFVIGIVMLYIVCIIYDWIIKPICRYFKRVSDHCNDEHGD